MKKTSLLKDGLVLIVIGAAFLTLLLVPAARAIPTYWQVATGNWLNPGNWTEGVPSGEDAAYINNGGTASITSSVGWCRDLTLGAGTGESGTVDMAGGNLEVSEFLYVGDQGTGFLYIEDGATFSESEEIEGVFIGYQAGGEGSVTVSGPGTIWSRPWGLEMRVGEDGQGSVIIQDGGLISGGSASIGTGATGNGIVTVTGTGSNWINSGLWVAEFGVGELIIEEGGVVSASYTEIGGVPGGDGTVTVSGDVSSLSNTEYLSVAGVSMGSLMIMDGAEVSAEWTSGIGNLSSSVGTVTLMGNGSSFICQEDFIVAMDGTGTFTQTGGTSTIANNLFLGYNVSSSGTYAISNGLLEVGCLFVGVDGGGTLGISGVGAEITVSNLLSFGPYSTLAAVLGASINLTGADFENHSANETELAGLANLELIFEGGAGDIDELEVACMDYGAVAEGFINNFALGKLTLGGADIGIVRLVDNIDNGNRGGTEGYDEALYVDRLELGAGSVLDLNNLRLYWRIQFVDHGGTIINGEVIQVEPNYDDWWPMYHHDLSHTGYSPSTAPSTNEVAWRYTTEDGMDSSPAVTDGMVYVGSNDGDVCCLDGFTGELLWTFTTGSEVNSSPAVADGRVYVGSDDYNVYCLPQVDPNGDGVIEPDELIWSYTTGYKVSLIIPPPISKKVWVTASNLKSDLASPATSKVRDVPIPITGSFSPVFKIVLCIGGAVANVSPGKSMPIPSAPAKLIN